MDADASLERFLAAAAPLRHGREAEPLRMFRLLHGMTLDGGDALSPSLDEALKVSIVAVAAPTARNAAIARYALERVAIAIEGRLGSAFRSSAG